MTEKKDIFFVGIHDPIELRRSLLESSKDIVHTMQRYERFKEVRTEKLEAIQELRNVMSQVKRMVGQLSQKLPDTELRVHLGKQEQKRKQKKAKLPEKKQAVQPEKKTLPPKAMGDLDKLESELAAIEQRLESLA